MLQIELEFEIFALLKDCAVIHIALLGGGRASSSEREYQLLMDTFCVICTVLLASEPRLSMVPTRMYLLI